MEALFHDLRYAFRTLGRSPGFSLVVVLILALGIGANTALFSVVRHVILKPLPCKEPERLARVWMDNRRLQMREDWASYLNYVDYKRLGTSFESMAAFTEPTVNLISDGEPERIRGSYAEAELFNVLGSAKRLDLGLGLVCRGDARGMLGGFTGFEFRQHNGGYFTSAAAALSPRE